MKCPNCGKSLWFARTFCPFCQTAIAAPARPRSVTVIGWLSLVLGLLVLAALFPKSPDAQRNMAQYGSQHPFLFARLWAGPVIALVCGVFMLRGHNWARWLYVVSFGYNVIDNMAHSSLRRLALASIPGLLIGAAAYYLFRPAATGFFRGRIPEESSVPLPDGTAQATCAECGAVFDIQDLISYSGVHVCARCKPVFFQRVAEGATIPPGSAPGRNAES